MGYGYVINVAEDGFSTIEHVISKRFVEKIFKRLDQGFEYRDDKGKFIGRIMAVDGPLGVIKIMSDHSLSTEDKPYVTIEVRYTGKTVLHLAVDKGYLYVYEFINGWWANKL